MRQFIVEGAPPEACGWNITKRHNYSRKYKDHWIVAFIRVDNTWSFGIDGAYSSSPFSTWQEAATFACDEVDQIVANEKELS